MLYDGYRPQAGDNPEMSGLDLATTRSYAPSFWECPQPQALPYNITLAIFNGGPGQDLDFNWNHRTNLQKYLQRH